MPTTCYEKFTFTASKLHICTRQFQRHTPHRTGLETGDTNYNGLSGRQELIVVK